MPTFTLPTNNEEIAADLKAAFEDSSAKLAAGLTELLSQSVDPPPPEAWSLGAINFGLYRERLADSITRRSKADRRA